LPRFQIGGQRIQNVPDKRLDLGIRGYIGPSSDFAIVWSDGVLPAVSLATVMIIETVRELRLGYQRPEALERENMYVHIRLVLVELREVSLILLLVSKEIQSDCTYGQVDDWIGGRVRRVDTDITESQGGQEVR
jgi:hypothetical protein